MKLSIASLGSWVSLFFFVYPLTFSFSFPVTVSDAPDNSLTLTCQAIRSATTSILINIYEFNSPEIADALIEKINAGVQTKVLEEGQPVGGYTTASRTIRDRVMEAMTQSGSDGNVFFSMRKSATGTARRFHYDHAKYTVIDGNSLLIGSENYSTTGTPKPGTKGNRGWEVWLPENNIAKKFETLFISDSNTQDGDVEILVGGNSIPKFPSLSPISLFLDGAPVRRPRPKAIPLDSMEAESLSSFTSPDSSEDGLLDLIGSANQSIDLELMSFSPTWGRTNQRSPLLEKLLSVARERGVKVRVLLNDESVFDHGKTNRHHKNNETVDILNQAAQDEHLPIQATIANPKRMNVTYIHNKGALIDGEKVLISSINWDENSIEKNRETALVLKGASVFSHYQRLFNKDWERSTDSSKQLSMRFGD